MKTICFITGNKNKLREATKILDDYKIESIKIDLDELQGERSYVAERKAKLAAEQLNKTVIVDDTALCFNALKGLPGIYIKHFLEKLGTIGLYNLVKDYDDKSADAVCSIGYCEPGKDPIVFEGICSGDIVGPKGKTDFGWDPIFMPKGQNKTYAELDNEIKNKISHRHKALMKLKHFLESK